MQVSHAKDKVYPMEATTVNQISDPWSSELWTILKPFVYLYRIFGSNYMTDSRSKWVKIPSMLYCAINFVNLTTITVCFLRLFNSNEGLKPDTIIKISGVLFMAICHCSMIFNLRFQFKIESILAVSLLINHGKVPNAKSFQRCVKFASVAVVVAAVITTLLTLMVAVPSSPIVIATKMNIFNNEVANIVYLCSCYTFTAGFNITIAYVVLLCSLLKGYVVRLQEAIKEIPNSLMIEQQLKAWRSDFRLLLALNARIQDMLGWITYCGTALYCVQMITMSLCFARGNLSTATAITLAAMTGFGFAGLLAQLLPVACVNEKMSKTKKHLGELMDVPRVSENDVIRERVLSLMLEVNLTGTTGISAWGFFFPTRNTFITLLSLFISYFVMLLRIDINGGSAMATAVASSTIHNM